MNEFDDPFNVLRQSRPSGQVTDDGRKIRLIGQPILALNRDTNNIAAVKEFRGHPCVAGRHFYTLPSGLLDALVAELGKAAFEPDLLRMERTLSVVCRDHSTNVGIWRDRLIDFQGLRPLPELSFSDEQARAGRMKLESIRHALRIYKERYAGPFERFRRGYIGWLMTNRQFLDEHDVLLTSHSETVRKWGTHLAGIMIPPGMPLPGTDPNEDPNWPSFIEACEDFFARWRLRGLAGPYMPIPLEALLAGSIPLSIVPQLQRAGGVFCIPDTMPILSRDQLRSSVDDALHRGERPDHLEEWLEMNRASNSARNQIDPFGRQFEIQHYWRIFLERHPSSVQGNVGRIEQSLAQFLKVPVASVHADLIEIRRRLGKDWLERAWPI